MLTATLIACLAGLLLGGLLFVVKTYNSLLASRQHTKNSFSQIEVQLKRRYDLIPQLVSAARAYLSHESETLEAVIAARQQASSQLGQLGGKLDNPQAMKSFAASEASLAGAMGRFSMVIESYPELKANEIIADLTEELTSTENRIAYARQLFNDMVTRFNIQRSSFPTIVFASMVGFSENLVLLQFDDQVKIYQAPTVDLVNV